MMLDGDGVRGDEELAAQRAGEDVSIDGRGGFGLEMRPRRTCSSTMVVVVGERGEVAVADEVAARVADVGDDGGIEAQGAEDQGGGHMRPTGEDAPPGSA